MSRKMINDLQNTFSELKEQGLYKAERTITSPQGAEITIAGGGGSGRKVLNFCANNYLGLCNDPAVIKAAKDTMDCWGYGLSSVRFICGTQKIHKELEQETAEFLGCEDAILYAACFDANGGLFEPLLNENDAIISDELNHASIIDGVRLCKAERYRYGHSDMADLKRRLEDVKKNRYRLICTDGVFSMDGDIAKLPEIVELAKRYDALVMVDDSHATGYIGDTGRGTAEFHGVLGKIDIITTTFGKALGGASGGCTAGRAEIIEMLRQRSRPYLFSNTLPPAVTGATREALRICKNSRDLIENVKENARYFRRKMEEAGFDIVPGNTAIVPVMLYDEKKAVAMADRLLDEGIYVIGFTYPVVPKGKARIRVQLSAAHTREDIETAVAAFMKIGTELGVI
jgi:glycine C-acetyltransferase